MSDDVIYYRVARMFGIGESMLETRLLDMIDKQTDLHLPHTQRRVNVPSGWLQRDIRWRKLKTL